MPASVSDPFERLARPIQRWIRDQGWATLRPVQGDTIDAILGTEGDVIVTAATAGGKTEAAFLPLLSDVFDRPSEGGGFDLVYIGPLKALITDQALRLSGICENTDLPVYPWHGDISESRKAKALKTPKGILLITPESLEAMFVLRGRQVPRLFAGARAVVIDELHTFLDSERGVQLRSLLVRLDIALGRRVRRVGLSATLGEMELTRDYLHPDSPEEVTLIQDEGGGQELRVQLRGCVEPGKDGQGPSAERAISEHIFDKLRGTRNLVFAGSRKNVEKYADRLARMCEKAHLPQEFLPHHASLSAERRRQVEDRLREGRLPLTAICTSTLELGIDIGDVTCVGQIGAPFSVASLRQRLGRSGRRADAPAILRMYIDMKHLDAQTNPIDRLRLELVQAVAMVELLVEGWCEPPKPQALHLSTLTQQILAIIAERGGASAARLYKMLCERGPFRAVTKELFAILLRDLAREETRLIEQSTDGTLLLGENGERIVADYRFYAVFQTDEEYRLLVDGKEIGTLPVDALLAPGMHLIFAGRRWRIEDIDDRAKVIELKPSKEGTPPKFGGDGGAIHDIVRDRMKTVLEDGVLPAYLDPGAADALAIACSEFDRLGLRNAQIISLGDNRCLLAPWLGTVKTTSLAFALKQQGFELDPRDTAFELDCSADDLRTRVLPGVAKVGLDPAAIAEANLQVDKFHENLSQPLLIQDALSSRIDRASIKTSVEKVLLQVARFS